MPVKLLSFREGENCLAVLNGGVHAAERFLRRAVKLEMCKFHVLAAVYHGEDGAFVYLEVAALDQPHAVL